MVPRKKKKSDDKKNVLFSSMILGFSWPLPRAIIILNVLCVFFGTIPSIYKFYIFTRPSFFKTSGTCFCEPLMDSSVRRHSGVARVAERSLGQNYIHGNSSTSVWFVVM